MGHWRIFVLELMMQKVQKAINLLHRPYLTVHLPSVSNVNVLGVFCVFVLVYGGINSNALLMTCCGDPIFMSVVLGVIQMVVNHVSLVFLETCMKKPWLTLRLVP
jgi:hypothetical protein